MRGFPSGSGVKNLPVNAGEYRHRFNSWVGKIPWRRDRLYTPVDLEAARFQMMVNTGLVSQAHPDIRRKPQKVDRLLAMTHSQLIEITDKVFRNRDIEAKREAENRWKEDSKRPTRGSWYWLRLWEGPCLGLPQNSHPL